jgi:flagellar biosynthesis protein FliR
MVHKTTHLPTVRLALAGYASLALLAWIGFVPSGLPAIFRRYGSEHPVPMLVSATISLLILVCLAPVLWRGPRRDRWLAVLLLVFPTLVFGVTTLWLVGQAF